MNPPAPGPTAALAYARTRRRASAQALLLALPLLLFLLATFIAPIAILLSRSVENREVPVNLPALSQALKAWNGEGLPDEHTFAILAADMRRASAEGQLGTVSAAAEFLPAGVSQLADADQRASCPKRRHSPGSRR